MKLLLNNVTFLLFLVYTAVKPCIGHVDTFVNPEHLKTLQQSKVQEEML